MTRIAGHVQTNDRQNDGNRYAWSDEGRVDLLKSVLIFKKPKVLLVCHCSDQRSCLSFCVFYNFYSKAGSFPISWFSQVLGHCHRWVLHVLGHCPRQLSCVSFAYVTLPPGRACEANDQRSAKRSVKSVGIDEFRMVLGGQATSFCFYPLSRVTRNYETRRHQQFQT